MNIWILKTTANKIFGLFQMISINMYLFMSRTKDPDYVLIILIKYFKYFYYYCQYIYIYTKYLDFGK